MINEDKSALPFVDGPSSFSALAALNTFKRNTLTIVAGSYTAVGPTSQWKEWSSSYAVAHSLRNYCVPSPYNFMESCTSAGGVVLPGLKTEDCPGWYCALQGRLAVESLYFKRHYHSGSSFETMCTGDLNGVLLHMPMPLAVKHTDVRWHAHQDWCAYDSTKYTLKKGFSQENCSRFNGKFRHFEGVRLESDLVGWQFHDASYCIIEGQQLQIDGEHAQATCKVSLGGHWTGEACALGMPATLVGPLDVSHSENCESKLGGHMVQSNGSTRCVVPSVLQVVELHEDGSDVCKPEGSWT